ncbi:MAG TPA: hypothetical protein VN643_17785 [Pyrinomonadaceae bacterium]|nr:hypothetical protein [Pyrinomonadaceae bacterium]
MSLDASLPERCIKCDSYEDVRYKVVQATSYSHWMLPFFFFLQIIPRFIVRMLLKEVRVEVALCKKHSSKWRRNLKFNMPLTLIGLGLLVFGFYYSVTNIGYEQNPLAKSLGFPGLVIFIIGAMACVIGGDAVHLKRRELGCVWLKGAGKSYLASLPQLPQWSSSR